MLLARCVGEIERTGAIAGLDATEYGRPIYLPLGFRDVFPLSRWAAANVARRHVPSAEDIEVGTPVQADLDLILRYDSARSGLQRGAILQDLWARAPGQARIAHRDGTIIGFAMSREGHRAMHIGPVVADDESVGIALASDLLSDTRAPMIIDVPDGHLGFAEWLRSVGASVSRSYVRMLRGSGPDIEGPNCVFALTGPELA
jgi:hypothetical protein